MLNFQLFGVEALILGYTLLTKYHLFSRYFKGILTVDFSLIIKSKEKVAFYLKTDILLVDDTSYLQTTSRGLNRILI